MIDEKRRRSLPHPLDTKTFFSPQKTGRTWYVALSGVPLGRASFGANRKEGRRTKTSLLASPCHYIHPLLLAWGQFRHQGGAGRERPGGKGSKAGKRRENPGDDFVPEFPPKSPQSDAGGRRRHRRRVRVLLGGGRPQQATTGEG